MENLRELPIKGIEAVGITFYEAASTISALEKKQDDLTFEINLVAGQIQDGIYKNAHVAQDQAEYEKGYEARLWHGMVDHVTVFSKNDIRFTMNDGMEVQA